MLDLTLDYHSHILPGCDHGSDSVETSRGQLDMAKAAGIRVLCATPHFYPHMENPDRFLRRRAQSFSRLQACLAPDDPQIRLGAEVLICDGLERMAELDALCLEGTSELLLELPFYHWPESIWDTIFRLHERDGIRLVIAHVDRYPVPDIERLIGEGIALQLNAEGLLKPRTRKLYRQWIEAGYVRYLGSDVHMLGTGYRDWEKCKKLLRKS